ncbi:FAD:protein FMN transferase [Ligilactobacillus sp. WILCCON 0076]|uniref:FAD:protein FMN transferase n=1 Tax=Ligilactobacillus ubinensis TaxID=2876789 RepID=A0A9X2JMG5_9LACO|nr:FAD:protein FMN transferase [Ligilactobacillus ubinensis]MCP0888057.1 FAD:protein FMN transferase [Ligilactobacillus ubinensis]
MTDLWTDSHSQFIDGLARRQLQKTYYGLGTRIVLTAFGTVLESDLDSAYAVIQRYEDLLTVNRDNSELMAINNAAGKHPVQVSTATYALTKLAVKMSQKHFGFNAAIGPLVKLWKIGFDDAHVPTDREIKEQLQLINPEKIILDDENLSVFLTQPGMELDLGGIAKGYIADRIQDLWRSRGIDSGIINLGGNLLLMGLPPQHADKLWRIGVQNPFATRGASIAAIKIGPCSAVTSGIYERHLEADGKSYHHILSPQTGYPYETNLAGVTVFSKYSVVGEIETTRLFFEGENTHNWGTTDPNLFGAIFVTKEKGIKLVGIPTSNVSLLDTSFHFI